jgi:hypothetical protein
MKGLILFLRDSTHRMREWLYSVPIDIRLSYIENTYLSVQIEREEYLMNLFLSPGVKEIIDWYLYEVDGEVSRIKVKKVDEEEKEFEISSVDSFLNYLQYIEQITA